MSHVLQLRGARALSAFRIAKLATALKRIAPGVQAVDAEFWHFVEMAKAPDAEARALLERPPAGLAEVRGAWAREVGA